MMVVDISALVAILFRESDDEHFGRAEAPIRLLLAVTRAGLSFVIEGRKRDAGRADPELLLCNGAFEVMSVTPLHAQIAVEAFRRFGTGRHRAGLSIGERFSYALATATNYPLLFKGGDFAETDIQPAV
jgi:ribonuclease VapC